MLHMSGVGAARLLAEPGDHPPAAGPVGTRGLLQTHPQCRGFLPTPQVSVLVPSIFSPLIPYSNTSALSKLFWGFTKLVSTMFSTFNITIVWRQGLEIHILSKLAMSRNCIIIFEGIMPLKQPYDLLISRYLHILTFRLHNFTSLYPPSPPR